MIEIGGTKSCGRLYLNELKLDCLDDIVIVKKTDKPNIEDTIARHKGRYHFVTSFCRPGMKVLDFPCGSGYGAEILGLQEVIYHGIDNDEITVNYAKFYYSKYGFFGMGNLKQPKLEDGEYNLIACIEGFEHIEAKYQDRLVESFYNALIDGGTLIITSPEKAGETTNPYHLHELTKIEFETLLNTCFVDVQILCLKDINHKGEKTNFMWGICKKED